MTSLIEFVASGSRMRSWTRPVLTSTSTAGTRPLPSARGTSRCDTVPRSDAASENRACRWAVAGMRSSMRLMVSVASIVCNVEMTRWPVSAAESAASAVSLSRISPMKMTSGS